MSEAVDATRPPQDSRHYRRGIYLLPSLFTIGNMFCGWACVVFSMRGQFEVAAPFIGIAVVLDSLDGRIARMTNTTSAFGLQFDSLADVISFGIAPAVLAFAWGLADLGRVGWATGFLFVTAAAMRLARFNLQSPTIADKRFFVGMPSPAAAGVVASTVYAWPYPLGGYPQSIAAVAVVLIPALLMVITLRFRSFKNINLGWMGSYTPIFAFAAFIVLVATYPAVTLVSVAYGYLASAFIEFAVTRLRANRAVPPPASP